LAEKSIFWTTGSTGDGAAAYTQAQLFNFFLRTFLTDPTTQGVIYTYLNAFAFLSGTSSPVQVGGGAAIVNGAPYLNDAALNLTVSTPVSGTTGFAVILRWDSTAQTVRCVIKSSADGTAAIPALTQSGSTWEIYLWQCTITTGGVIAILADKRKYIVPNVNFYVDGTGSSGSKQIIEKAVIALAVGSTVVTFAQPFSATPTVIISAYGSSTIGTKDLFITSITTTGFTVLNSAAGTVNMSYHAYGVY
jgi:hypothetical protein